MLLVKFKESRFVLKEDWDLYSYKNEDSKTIKDLSMEIVKRLKESNSATDEEIIKIGKSVLKSLEMAKMSKSFGSTKLSVIDIINSDTIALDYDKWGGLSTSTKSLYINFMLLFASFGIRLFQPILGYYPTNIIRLIIVFAMGVNLGIGIKKQKIEQKIWEERLRKQWEESSKKVEKQMEKSRRDLEEVEQQLGGLYEESKK